MNIIGISGVHQNVAFKVRELPGLSERQYRINQGFDSAAALVDASGIVAAAAEERFTPGQGHGRFSGAGDPILSAGGQYQNQ